MLHKLFEVAAFAAMTIASVALWFSADALPVSKRYAQVDADLWPKMVFGALAICCAVHLAQKVAGLIAAPSGMPLSEDEKLEAYRPEGYHLRLALTGGLVVGYFFALQYIGFLLATVIFLWAGAWILPFKNTAAKLTFAPVFTVLLAVLFSYGLQLSLPRGTGVFYDLSQALF
ncbi:tripartite tricarboxylate transporter TctB family protein [Salipiger mangrovisoli]|uniref:Tripartite tricarboxylate transporter TctB family protein n=1 Tax=Salipiger mangrovisoli TaxID=2865933 RepID=A0ABR9XA89_9RHOB|nr:tripartite tricarboxylate transporter TctB family protein [Salipiger mangrovisoli]MBE9640361.1 tripartite tricarboxylate transporter TctB family protein [Salipiger mangrovisoli]